VGLGFGGFEEEEASKLGGSKKTHLYSKTKVSSQKKRNKKGDAGEVFLSKTDAVWLCS